MPQIAPDFGLYSKRIERNLVKNILLLKILILA